MKARKVLIVSENEEKYRSYRGMVAGRTDGDGILRAGTLEEAVKTLRTFTPDVLVVEPQALLVAELPEISPKERCIPIRGNAREDLGIVRSYIFTHYGEKLSLALLSSLIAVTPNHLCYVFRQAEGMGVSEFVEKTRLERAAALLCGTDDPVSAVAGKVGYHNNSYFCRRFREVYGITPKKYRIANRKK